MAVVISSSENIVCVFANQECATITVQEFDCGFDSPAEIKISSVKIDFEDIPDVISELQLILKNQDEIERSLAAADLIDQDSFQPICDGITVKTVGGEP